MATYLVRVVLPDRPGALGAVASRIGAVRGDVTAVEIVERRTGSAVDEFVVELADESRLTLLLSEIGEVDGVTVEEVHPVPGRGHDRRFDAYDTAVAVMQARTPHDVLAALARRVGVEFEAAWAAVVDVEQALVVAAHGRPPTAPWLAALVAESRAATGTTDAPGTGDVGRGSSGPDVADSGEPADAAGEADAGRPVGAAAAPEAGYVPRPEAWDIGWVELSAWDLVLAAGRPGLHFGARERAHLAALARLADARWVDLAEREGRVSQPGLTG